MNFVVPTGDRRLALIEARATHSVQPAMAGSLVRLRDSARQYKVASFVVHRGVGDRDALTALRPGVKAVALDALLSSLA